MRKLNTSDRVFTSAVCQIAYRKFTAKDQYLRLRHCDSQDVKDTERTSFRTLSQHAFCAHRRSLLDLVTPRLFREFVGHEAFWSDDESDGKQCTRKLSAGIVVVMEIEIAIYFRNPHKPRPRVQSQSCYTQSGGHWIVTAQKRGRSGSIDFGLK